MSFDWQVIRSTFNANGLNQNDGGVYWKSLQPILIKISDLKVLSFAFSWDFVALSTDDNKLRILQRLDLSDIN